MSMRVTFVFHFICCSYCFCILFFRSGKWELEKSSLAQGCPVKMVRVRTQAHRSDPIFYVLSTAPCTLEEGKSGTDLETNLRISI